jgi:hypothetical protein
MAQCSSGSDTIGFADGAAAAAAAATPATNFTLLFTHDAPYGLQGIELSTAWLDSRGLYRWVVALHLPPPIHALSPHWAVPPGPIRDQLEFFGRNESGLSRMHLNYTGGCLCTVPHTPCGHDDLAHCM